MKDIFKFIIRFLVVIIGIIGVLISSLDPSGFMKLNSFLYFTVQSNIWIILVFALFLILDITGKVTKKDYFKPWMYVVKYVFTISITLTFFVFTFMLLPLMELSYILSFGNFSVHFIVPILSIIDFFVNDKIENINKYTFLYSSIPPIYYLFFSLILSTTSVRYLDGAKVPYFFLDYENLGWFKISKDGIGVIYWVIILTIFVLLTAFLFLKIKTKMKKQG